MTYFDKKMIFLESKLIIAKEKYSNQKLKRI